MREILFKAKRIDKNEGKWVIGYVAGPHSSDTEKGIVSYYFNELDEIGWTHQCIVSAETICQYTGLTDKNGNKIWENDIVFVTDDDGNSGQVDTGIGEIDFLEGIWYISGRVQNSLYDINKCFQIKKIGNIFDNPELLKESKQK